MANITCDCGHVFSDAGIPCRFEYNLISDSDGEKLTEEIVDTLNTQEDAWPKVDYLISKYGISTFLCPSCSGLLIFWNGIEKVATYYKKNGD